VVAIVCSLAKCYRPALVTTITAEHAERAEKISGT
jgi:hypothetical protein